MSLASELSGFDALARIQSRVQAYWDRTWERRLIASLLGALYSNVSNNGSDMVNDISGASGAAASFSASAVINTALTLGDRLEDVKAIAMHSAIYGEALQNDLIQFIPQSQGLGVSRETFKRWCEDDESLQDAFDIGRETERQALHALIVQSALMNKPANVNAFFILKARHGYRSKTRQALR
ncbi:MAG: hypothetical protein M3Y50_07640 [Acidobacteriota bacterium]|nr:hypothetical protein [Acidobacteriota bacterium]